MTTVAELRAAVNSMTGDIQNVMFSSADVLRYLNWGCQELSRELKIMSAVQTGIQVLTYSGVGGIQLNPDFVVENSVYAGLSLTLQSRLERMPEDDYWIDTIVNTAVQPTHYIITDYAANAQYRWLLPYPHMIPATSLYYKIDYQNRPQPLVNDSDTVNLPSVCDETLALFAVSRCKLQENDFAAAQAFKSEYNERKKLIIADFADHNDYSFHNIPDRTGTGPTYVWD